MGKMDVFRGRMRAERVTAQQIASMLRQMAADAHLASGQHSRTIHKEKWDDLCDLLNLIGPSKSPEKWHKVWQDLKSRARKNYLGRKKKLNNIPLSPNDEEIIRIIGTKIPRRYVDSDAEDGSESQTAEAQDDSDSVLNEAHMQDDNESDHGDAGQHVKASSRIDAYTLDALDPLAQNKSIRQSSEKKAKIQKPPQNSPRNIEVENTTTLQIASKVKVEECIKNAVKIEFIKATPKIDPKFEDIRNSPQIAAQIQEFRASQQIAAKYKNVNQGLKDIALRQYSLMERVSEGLLELDRQRLALEERMSTLTDVVITKVCKITDSMD